MREVKEYERIIPGDNTMWNVCSIVTYFYFHLSLVLVLFIGIWYMVSWRRGHEANVLDMNRYSDTL